MSNKVTPAELAKLNGISTTATELGYVSGVSSAIQTQISAKAPSASPTFTGTIGTPLTSTSSVSTDSSGNLQADAWSTFSPTVTLVGGAGNTVPVYTTNTGRYIRQGKIVHVKVYLTGDGGAEGAGSGNINIALPVTAGANEGGDGNDAFPVGWAKNSTTGYYLYGNIASSGSTIALTRLGATTTSTLVSFQGVEQNNTTRLINIRFFYEVD